MAGNPLALQRLRSKVQGLRRNPKLEAKLSATKSWSVSTEEGRSVLVARGQLRRKEVRVQKELERLGQLLSRLESEIKSLQEGREAASSRLSQAESRLTELERKVPDPPPPIRVS